MKVYEFLPEDLDDKIIVVFQDDTELSQLKSRLIETPFYDRIILIHTSNVNITGLTPLQRWGKGECVGDLIKECKDAYL